MGKIVAVCSSSDRGERKKNTGRGRLIKNLGLKGDAHAGFGHRQVSLLALESIAKMQAMGLEAGPGDFAENITTRGIDLTGLLVGTRLNAGPARIRVTQIGKECTHRCAIYDQAGDCVMPREGIFAEVLLGGEVAAGDPLEPVPSYRFGVLTASDKGASGERTDRSGPTVSEFLLPWGDVVDTRIVPDEQDLLRSALREMVSGKLDAIFTTGGTGLSPRDCTPEATREIIDRPVPGIPEALRACSLAITPRAMLTRGIAGICGRTLIINLPGSSRAVTECLEVLKPVLDHALETLTGHGGECARL